MLHAPVMMGFLSKWDGGRQLSDQPADDGIPGGQKLDRAYAIMTSQNPVVGRSTRPAARKTLHKH
jgi:hypothetical protein